MHLFWLRPIGLECVQRNVKVAGMIELYTQRAPRVKKPACAICTSKRKQCQRITEGVRVQAGVSSSPFFLFEIVLGSDLNFKSSHKMPLC